MALSLRVPAFYWAAEECTSVHSGLHTVGGGWGDGSRPQPVPRAWLEGM